MTRADGRSMAVRLQGAGPPLVCLAGGPGADAHYLEDLGGLAVHRTLVVPDARGTGRSDPSDAYGFDVIADDVEALRRHLGFETVALAAHSAACTSAIVYAARHPQRVGVLVLVAPSSFLLAGVVDDTSEILERRSGEPWYDEARAPASYARWSDRERRHAELMLPQRRDPVVGFWTAEVDPAAVLSGIEGVAAAVLVVTGDLDAATGVVAGAAWAGHFPSATHVSLAGVAHIPWVDDPVRFRGVVAEFLGPTGS